MPFRLLCTKGEKTELVGYGARVDLLDNTSIHLILSRNWTGSQCLQKIAEKIGLNEISYFGLQYNTKKGREHWVLLDKPLRHQLEKYAANGLSNTVLRLGVHFYVSDINRLRDEITRYYYYLQLRNSVLQGRIPCDEELAVILASYCAQAEFGDYVAANHKSYVKDYVLLPSTLIATCTQDELNQQIIALHQSHSGLSKAEAELEYIKLTQKLDGYGDEYFPATDKDGFVILVGASFMGIVVRHPHGLPPVYFKWQDIVRLSHSKNFFNVESTRTFDVIQFEMEGATTAKYVWRMLVLHHQFYRLNFKTSHSNTSTKPRRMELERQITLPKSHMSVDTEDVSMRQNEELKKGSSYNGSRGLVNPLFDDDDHVTQGEVPFSDLVDGYTNHDMAEIHANSEFPVHRTCSGSTTEGSYRPGSLEYLSDPELKRSSVCSNLSEPMRSRNQSQESLKNLAASSEEKLLGVGDAERSSSTDSMNCTGITNWSSETKAGEASCDNKPGSSRVHAMNGGMAACEASVQVASGAAELRPAQQARNSRPSSQLTDDSSVVTGRTSGYSTSTDSEEFEADDEAQLGPGPEAGPMTRESQLEHLEKLVREGAIFTEYQKVERASEIVNVSTAQLPANAARNRYKDVVPYEETRVHLDPRNNTENNDYINASFVKMRVGRKDYSYIAAQGPMENTAPDFWQMVWEQEVRIIVMATEIQTNKKRECHRYWPGDLEKSRTQFGRFTLETQSVRDASPFKVRKLCLLNTLSGQQRTVHHLQFNAWPDHGVPENPQCFLEFVEELESVRQQVALASGHSAVLPPMVVHCTAGVGRTGVILMADLMIACLQSNQRINVPKTLINLRRQRMLLVANFGQYRFIYTVVIHYIRNSRLI